MGEQAEFGHARTLWRGQKRVQTLYLLACPILQGKEGKGQGWQAGWFGAIPAPGKSAVDERLANLVRSGRKQP